MPAINTNGLTKSFGNFFAVQDLNLEVEQGEVFGFLGPNGAGKSTTINMFLDFMRPTQGSVEILGHDSREETVKIRQRTGILPENFDVYERLTGKEHIEFAIESKETNDDPIQVLRRVGLGDAAERRAGNYSKGMRQRLALGMALVGQPDLLILDEPSTGLDPNGARRMREIVHEENERGATVFFSSHILGQVEQVCDRVGIMHAGNMVEVDTIDALREKAGTKAKLNVEVAAWSPDQLSQVETIQGVSNVVANGNTVTVSCDSGGAKLETLNKMQSLGIEIKDFSTSKASLEDLFAAYTTNQQPPRQQPRQRQGMGVET